METRFHGIVPAMATPFTNDFRLDEGVLHDLIEWYIDSGVHGISVCGSQGEFYALEREERLQVIETAARAINGRVPFYAGTGAATTRDAIAFSQAAEGAGADIAMVITPYFISPSADELVAHYHAIARATKLPVMIYNNPPRTAVNVTPAIYSRCAEADNIIGIKDSSGDVTQIADYIRINNGRRLVFAGRDTIILSTVLHGGSGAISPAANVFPRLVVRLYDAVRAGNLENARALSNLLAPLRVAWGLGSFPVVIKEAMDLVGRSAGPARPPILPLATLAREELARVLQQIEAGAAT